MRSCMHTGSYKPCFSTSKPVPTFAPHASSCNVYMSTFDYNQSLEQELLRAGEKYLIPTHITLILTNTGRGKQWFPDNQAHFVFIPSVSKRVNTANEKLAFHFSQDHCRKSYCIYYDHSRSVTTTVALKMSGFFKI